MPTYEYKCQKCKKTFDQLQSMSEAPLKKCIYCKGKVERLIGAGAGLIFKGSGFYITDYKKRPSEGSKQKAESKAEGGKEKSEGGKAPEAKKESQDKKPKT